MPITIRLATLDDAEQVQGIYAPYCRTPISFEEEPPSALEMRDRMTKVLAEYPWLVCEADGVVLGYAYAARHRERAAYRWSVDTTVYVREDQQRRGVGRALYTSLFAMLPLQGLVNAYAGVTLPNAGSVGLHEAVGFRTVGIYRQVGFKYGVWHDVVWLHRALQPLPASPAAVKRLEEVKDSAEWGLALRCGSIESGGAA
jgi:L-amino acid N-acyltransferase YncA